MMFPISCLVYSVNYFTCLLITYLVYSEKKTTTRTNRVGKYNIKCMLGWDFMVYNKHPCPRLLGVGWLLTINPKLLCIIYYRLIMQESYTVTQQLSSNWGFVVHQYGLQFIHHFLLCLHYPVPQTHTFQLHQNI